MFVKVCGLRTEADVAVAVAAGADAIGFVLAPSPRQVTPAQAGRLAAAAPERVLTVGVFAGMAAAEAGRTALAAGLGAVQLHGAGYGPAAFAELAPLPLKLIRATALAAGGGEGGGYGDGQPPLQAGAWGEDMLLLDSPVAGSGRRWDLAALAAGRPQGRWLLAGGLEPGNVAAAIGQARPWGVDVSSGVESRRGVKDHGRIRAFMAATRAAVPGPGPAVQRPAGSGTGGYHREE
jgi:phosphoribosylanthranilate isomerase